MRPQLILTVDYEVFGNGQGCVSHCVVEPAARLLRVADTFSAPVTFFVDAAEFMAMERVLGAAAVRDVKLQLRSAVRAGHDVQLHLHPQWEGATQSTDGTWQLDFRRWRIGDLAEADIDTLVRSGKAWLEDAAFAGTPGGQCTAFRAGSWCIQPSGAVLRSLQRAGFTVESTVVPGMRRPGLEEWSDFRSVPDLAFWRVDEDVCTASDAGLWEVPIASARVSRVAQLVAQLMARTAGHSGFAADCHGSYRVGSKNRVGATVRKLLDLGMAKLDVSTMPADILAAVTRSWTQRFAHVPQPTPVVAIAHTKNWTERSSTQLSTYLAWARAEGIECSTYPRWLSQVEPRSTGVAPVTRHQHSEPFAAASSGHTR